MPSKERSTRPDPDQLDLSTLLEGFGRVTLSEEAAQAHMAETARVLEEALGDHEQAVWAQSSYRWVRNLATGRKSKAAERLVAGALAAQGVVPARPAALGHDFTYNNDRYKVRMSMRWASGEYVFQQLHGGDYDLVCLLGISPDRVHLWVLDQDTLAEHATATTGWLSFPAGTPPTWLRSHGGSLTAAVDVICARAAAR